MPAPTPESRRIQSPVLMFRTLPTKLLWRCRDPQSTSMAAAAFSSKMASPDNLDSLEMENCQMRKCVGRSVTSILTYAANSRIMVPAQAVQVSPICLTLPDLIPCLRLILGCGKPVVELKAGKSL